MARKVLGRANTRPMASGIWRHTQAEWARQPSAIEEPVVVTSVTWTCA